MTRRPSLSSARRPEQLPFKCCRRPTAPAIRRPTTAFSEGAVGVGPKEDEQDIGGGGNVVRLAEGALLGEDPDEASVPFKAQVFAPLPDLGDPFLPTRRLEHRPERCDAFENLRDAGGAVMVGDARMPPMTSGPSLHVHSREDEAVYVVAGHMTFRVGERTFQAGPGSFVWLPREVPHTFANLSGEEVWAFGITLPPGLEAMFVEQSEYFASFDGQPDEAVVRAIGARFGVRSVGPPLAPSSPVEPGR